MWDLSSLAGFCFFIWWGSAISFCYSRNPYTTQHSLPPVEYCFPPVVFHLEVVVCSSERPLEVSIKLWRNWRNCFLRFTTTHLWVLASVPNRRVFLTTQESLHVITVYKYNDYISDSIYKREILWLLFFHTLLIFLTIQIADKKTMKFTDIQILYFMSIFHIN